MALFSKVSIFFVFLGIFLIGLFFVHFFHSIFLGTLFYAIVTIFLIEALSRLIYKYFRKNENKYVIFNMFPPAQEAIGKLSQKIDKLNLHRANLLKVIENVRLGVILVDNKDSVLLSNRYVANLLGPNIENGKSLVDGWKDYRLVSLFNKLKNENLQKVEFENKILKFDKIPITNGYIMIIEDITKEESYQKMKMNFFSNASHELKTPITTIVGYAETLLSNKNIDRKDQMKFLKYIYQNALNLNDLINNILQLAKIEDYSQTSLSLQTVDLENLINQLNIHHLLPNKNIRFIKECNLKNVFFNEYHLKTILNNLLDNAYFYTKEGFIKLKCYANDNYYVFEVQDSGIGIEKSQQELIFERFYKIKSKGSGLGLAIVKHLVLLYNGTIEVESTPGFGSLFRLRFPKKE